MENNESAIIFELSTTLKSFTELKPLSIINSQITIENLPLNIFENIETNDINQSVLSFYLYLVQAVISKTENSIILSIEFDSKTILQSQENNNNEFLKENVSKNNLNFSHIPFKSLERIIFLFYSFAIETKFIENKQFFVNFPQTKTEKQTYDNNLPLAHEKFNINLFDENISNDKNNFKKVDLETYLNSDLQLCQESILKKVAQMETCISSTPEDLLLFSFNSVALGGSFDHFHMGHNMLLNTASLLCKEKLLIGITSQEMISKKASQLLLQPYEIRKANVKIAYECMGGFAEIDFFPLNDPAGKAATEVNLQALILTEETIKGGQIVNSKRKENNLDELKLISANLICEHSLLVLDTSKEKSKISSTSIRNEIKKGIDESKLIQLENLWKKLTIAILKCCPDVSNNWFSKIRDLYMQSWRAYHSLNHIFIYATLADELHSQGKIKDYVNILLSVWFHDIIYNPTRNDNEERSFQTYLNFYDDIKQSIYLENTFELVDSEKIKKYIMATKYHFSDETYEESDINYFLDLDLYSFGTPNFDDYFKISNKIKYEFTHHLTEKQWNEGRAKFLKSVLNKGFIFRTEEYRELLENNARNNIKAEIAIYENKN